MKPLQRKIQSNLQLSQDQNEIIDKNKKFKLDDSIRILSQQQLDEDSKRNQSMTIQDIKRQSLMLEQNTSKNSYNASDFLVNDNVNQQINLNQSQMSQQTKLELHLGLIKRHLSSKVSLISNPSSKAQSFMNKYADLNTQIISETYMKITQLMQYLNDIHNTLLTNQEKDFMVAFKDTMTGVQQEMAQLKKKTTEEYQKMKKDERIQYLEQNIEWLRSEMIKMMKQLEIF